MKLLKNESKMLLKAAYIFEYFFMAYKIIIIIIDLFK